MASTKRNNVMVHDVLEAIIIDEAGVAKYFGATTEASVSQSISKEDLRASIGNDIKATINSDKAVTFSVTSLFHNDDFLSMQAGSDFTSVEQFVPYGVSVKADSTTLDLATILGVAQPADMAIGGADIKYGVVTDEFGTVAGDLTYDGVTNWEYTGATIGKVYHFAFVIKQADVQTLEINADNMPKNAQVYLHGIAYNPADNQVIADIYYYFPIASPDGNVDRSYSGGSNINDSIGFTTIADGDGNYAKYFVVDR